MKNKKTQSISKNRNPEKMVSGIFWRENFIPDAESLIHILMKRAPGSIPKWVSRKDAQCYILHGKTSLEQKVRKSIIEGLYGR